MINSIREIKFRAYFDGKMIYPTGAMSVIRRFFRVIPEDAMFMQYTGLKDRNGKEIYEGDIQDYGDGRIVVVEFKDGCFGLRMPNGDFEKTWVRPDQFKVIGNVYENPELCN